MKTKFDNDIMMASLFANATEGIVLANRAGEIVLANPCAEGVLRDVGMREASYE